MGDDLGQLRCAGMRWMRSERHAECEVAGTGLQPCAPHTRTAPMTGELLSVICWLCKVGLTVLSSWSIMLRRRPRLGGNFSSDGGGWGEEQRVLSDRAGGWWRMWPGVLLS